MPTDTPGDVPGDGRLREALGGSLSKGWQAPAFPKLEALLVSMHRSDEYTTGEFAELFDFARATVCGASARGKTDNSAFTLPSAT